MDAGPIEATGSWTTTGSLATDDVVAAAEVATAVDEVATAVVDVATVVVVVVVVVLVVVGVVGGGIGPALVTPARLGRWMTPGVASGQQRPSYAENLRVLLSEEELTQVGDLFRKALLNRPVAWQTTTAFITAR